MHDIRIRFFDVRDAWIVLAVEGTTLGQSSMQILKHIERIPVSPHLGHVVHYDIKVLSVSQVINCKLAHPVLNLNVQSHKLALLRPNDLRQILTDEMQTIVV